MTFLKQLITFLILLCNYGLLAQDLPIAYRIEDCRTTFSSDEVARLREELNALEDYLIRHGLLTDDSGRSYLAVYERIAVVGDLYFKADTTFGMLDSLEFRVLVNCYDQLLSQEQLEQINKRHRKAIEKITTSDGANITPGLIAQRVVDNLSADDLELEQFRIASLLVFYHLALQVPDLGNPDSISQMQANLQTVKVLLTPENAIEIDGVQTTLDEAKTQIANFIAADPAKRGIAFSASKRALYTHYLEVYEMMNRVYTDLTNEMGAVPKNIIYEVVP